MVTTTHNQADIHIYQKKNVTKGVVDGGWGGAVEHIGGSLFIEVHE